MFACDLWMVHVLRAAPRLIGGVPKFGHIGEFMRDTLHWLPVRQRIFYRASTIAWRCNLGVAPAYNISELFVLSSSCAGRQSLRSASRGYYLIPRSYTAIKQNRASSAAGPSIWNGLLSNCALYHVIFLVRFIVCLRPSFLSGLGLGTLLSSYLEGALYKCQIYMYIYNIYIYIYIANS